MIEVAHIFIYSYIYKFLLKKITEMNKEKRESKGYENEYFLYFIFLI